MKSIDRNSTTDSLVLYLDSPFGMFLLDHTSASVPQISVEHSVPPAAFPTKGKIEKAIYAHIRAVRALGRKRINTAEIAAALSLPLSDVNRALSSLRKKGVRPL